MFNFGTDRVPVQKTLNILIKAQVNFSTQVWQSRGLSVPCFKGKWGRFFMSVVLEFQTSCSGKLVISAEC